MTFSYSAVWDDTLALLRLHGALLAAIGGVFLFLPALLIAQFLPEPEVTDPALILEALQRYYLDGLVWFVLTGLVGMVGGAAMLRLVLAQGTSVGGAIVYGAMLLPFYFVLSVATGLIFLVGFILLIVPGLYLMGRLAVAGPAMIAEDRRDPFATIARSFELTKDRGWAVFGLVVIVVIVGGIGSAVASMLVGSVMILAAGQELGRLLTAAFDSAVATLFSTVLLVLYAAIYRALTGTGSTAGVFD